VLLPMPAKGTFYPRVLEIILAIGEVQDSYVLNENQPIVICGLSA